ncbi:MAG: OmpH family outer membrane protein, partial [Burkholderiales bacterium]
EELRTIIAELSALRDQIADKANPLDEATGRQLARTYEIKRQEAQTLQQEYENFKEEREKEINRRMIAAMRASLDRISKTSAQIAKKRGFDAVFDSTGETNTGLPFVLYHKEAPDLTPDVQAVLRESEPPAAEPPTAKPVAGPPEDHGAGHYD